MNHINSQPSQNQQVPQQRVIIVMPTYNEKLNIEPMLQSLSLIRQEMLPQFNVEVLIVDDNSPDGTQDIVRQFMSSNHYVHLITGDKKGLGIAYIRGIQQALDWGASIVFQMDADFSHDPMVIKQMLSEISQGADFVIGSRYISGGSIPKDWHLWRKLNSLVGNLVARLIAGIYRVRDCTSGYRAIQAKLLDKLDLSEIRAQGYGFQVSLLYEAYTHNAKIVEVPIQFLDRTLGKSKLGVSDILEFVYNAFAIRLKGSKTLFKFLMVGASGVLVNLGLFDLFLGLNLNKFVSSPLAIEGSIIWNFFLNNHWTFRKRTTKRNIVMKGLYFNLVSIGSLAISYSTFVVLSLLWPGGNTYLFQSVGIIPASLVNYFFNSYFTFKAVEH